MAFDTGGGGAGGTLPPPPPTPSSGPDTGINPNVLPGIPPYVPSNIPNAILNVPPTITTPDYNALVNQYMAPYQALVDKSLAAMQSQMNKQRGFAQTEYGIESDAASEAHKQAAAHIINLLAARGMLQSGARKVRGRFENTRYSQQMGLMQNALQRYLYGLTSQYQNAQMSAESSLAQQRIGLGMQLAAMYPAQVSAGPGALPAGFGTIGY